MAGESPDRSKQRESSAGATSGHTDSVPEARDPRLAVARGGSGGSTGAGAGAGGGQKDSSNGGTDTATKVFRTPAIEEDTALCNAVSSWVRDADEPEASTDAPTKDAEGPEAAAADTDAEGDADAQGTTGAINDGAAGSGADAGTADADSGADAGTAHGDSGADAKADAEGNGAEADAGSGAKADGADAGAEVPAGDTDAGAKAGTGQKTAGAGSVKAGADDDGDGGSKADANANADGKGEGEKAPAGAEAATDAGEGSKPGADDGSAKADAEAEALADGAAAKAGAGAESDTGAKAASSTKADAQSKTPADADTKGAVGAKADAGAKAGGQSKAPAGAVVAGAKADADAEGGADAKDDTGADAKADADAKSGGKAERGAEAKDADGAEGRQGPPAADDESRTGGAGGKTAGGGAEAKGKGKGKTGGADAVDQPTAIFKAVRPKDQVDQPTTMLKLGKGAKQDEPESERTSKFVALKDDVRHKPASAPADETTAVPQIGPERTTQQPLPPKPPLDLLAELTNTPPPPETPVRTALRRVKIWTPLVLLLVIIFAVVQTLRPLPSPTLALTAKDSYTFDGGRVNLPWPSEGQGWMDGDGIGTMGNFGKQTPVAIGSVAKTMTAYIILRDHPLKPGQEGPKIKVDATAEKEAGYSKDGESTLDTVHAGDTLTEKQALSAVMIPSANNIARLLARWDAGSEAAFVKKMNATAKELGMTGTTYTDPSGLKETTVSTAQDQVKIGRAVVKIPALVAITSAASWTDPSGHNWRNYNDLPILVGAIGIKTGSTTAAGGNLLFAARKKVGGQTVTVVGAILGQHKPSILDTVNAVSKTALLGAENALTSAKILKKGDVVGYVDDQLGGQTPIVVTQDVTAVGWSGLKVKLSFASDTVPHTAKAGTKVGTLTVGDGSTAGIKVPVALQQDLAEPGFGAKLTRIG
ncbi:D-alanyl-D-alanine carboxypeptidase [Streptomyces sp. NPDC046976]|uniref:D-alanyl-D-alanine carboxypeptidase n=1 Tax=Streptomyces sp. NPDC046976 TaxID=3155258 RepID=UPI0033C4151B